MKTDRNRQPGWCAIVLALSASFFAGCGPDNPTGTTIHTKDGVVTTSAATVGLKTCTGCHTVQTADWMNTKHANVEPAGYLYSAGNPTLGQIASCAVNCHDPQGDSGQLVANATGNTARPVVGCESCHGGGELHVAAGGAGPIGFATIPEGIIGGTTSSLQASAQFRTCTACHELLSANDPASSTTPTVAAHDAGGSNPRTPADSITDTHFAVPNLYASSGSNAISIASLVAVTGYSMDFLSERVCVDCHNPHGNTKINQEWSQSAHADRTAATGTYLSGAWARYNWSCNITSASTVTLGCGTSDRRACQRCHTSSGFIAYADTLRAGDSTRAANIRRGAESLVSYSGTSYWKPEMLKCNACHTDYKGTLRNPGAITADYDFYSITTTLVSSVLTTVTKNYSFASYPYPDVSGSNVCLACHTGRESGDSIKNLNDPWLLSAGTITFFDFSNSSFINSHYLTAGGTVFTATGYEFPGLLYENIDTYRHNQIGSSAVPNTGTDGPCIGCHMSRPGKNGNHLFLPVTRSSITPGYVDGIASQVCIYCHTVSGAGGLEDLINERKTELEESVKAAAYVLGKRGFYFREAYPYFYQLRLDSSSTGTFGTVGVTNGSATVTGTNTQWVTASTSTVIYTGTNKDYFKVDNDGTWYQIIGATDTTLTLATPYTGATGTGLKYTIIKSGSAGGIKNWLTKAGTGILPAAATDTDTTGNTTGKNNMGAAFNINLLAHDPGAYAHNRMYTKRLLYDAIDWADDNTINFSTGSTLNGLDAGAEFKAGAMKYLLPYGVLGIQAERP